MKHRKTILIIIGNLVAAFLLVSYSQAQDNSGYIYGRVSTVNGDYVGKIRWGDEETFWFDHFNAAKKRNQNLEELSEKYGNKKKSDWLDFDWSLESIWADKIGLSHQYTSQFGDIRRIIVVNSSTVKLELKNGREIMLSGEGYNDIGTTVRVQDKELDDLSIRWDRITEIEFLPTPSNLKVEHGRPIYGTVETFRKGTFTGFIQWDNDERLSNERLDGDSNDEDVSLAFSTIRSIEKKGNGSLVVLMSGREFYLTNSNDVNDENRGIIVTDPQIGRVEIPWKYFQKCTLKDSPGTGPSFTKYPAPQGIRGTVYTVDGDELTGQLIYDIDEKWELEMLEGNDDDVEYIIPFRNIATITPKNYAYSMIELKNGEKILMGGSRDVSDDNDGILVYKSNDQEPAHVPWDKVIEIRFD
jgi:hypothetical protein